MTLENSRDLEDAKPLEVKIAKLVGDSDCEGGDNCGSNGPDSACPNGE